MFSIFGYISVLLWLVSLPLMGLHFRRRPRRWLCHYAVVLVLVAFVLAHINSRFYVNRLQVDQSEAIAAAQARQAEARQRAEDERADDVAQVRFAEDDRTDFLDMGGLDDADRKYIESMTEDEAPAWQQQKQQRSSTPADDGSLDAQLDTTKKAGGVDSGKMGQKAENAVVLPENVVMLANRLDSLNLSIIRWLLLAGLVALVVDYLQRFNRFEEAYLPLPLPSAWGNSLTPLPTVCTLPPSHRRTPVEELAWLVRRGDTFLYLTADADAAAAIPEQLPRLPRGKRPFDVLHVPADDPLIDDAFIFEALWYNRAAFIVDATERAEPLLTTFYAKLAERHQTRAHVRQTVHIVWDLEIAPGDALYEDYFRLLGAAGMCLREGFEKHS